MGGPSRQDKKHAERSRGDQMAHSWLDAVASVVTATEAAKKARAETSVVEGDLQDMTNEAIAATDAIHAVERQAQQLNLEAATVTAAAAKNIIDAHQAHIQSLSGEVNFLRHLIADCPLLAVAAHQVQLRIAQLKALQLNLKQTIAVEASWAQPVQSQAASSSTAEVKQTAACSTAAPSGPEVTRTS